MTSEHIWRSMGNSLRSMGQLVVTANRVLVSTKPMFLIQVTTSDLEELLALRKWVSGCHRFWSPL